MQRTKNRRRIPRLAPGVSTCTALATALLVAACGPGVTTQAARTLVVPAGPTSIPSPDRGAVSVGAGSGGPSRAPTSPIRWGEGLELDAREYSKDVGVSVEEAVRRLKLQRVVGKLGTTLHEREADVLGGVWTQHRPDFRVLIALKGAGYERIRGYVEGGPLEGMVEVRAVDATYEELEGAQDEATRIVGRLGLPYSSGINAFKNHAEIQTTDPARLRTAMDAAGVKLPDHVEVVRVSSLPQPAVAGGVKSAR